MLKPKDSGSLAASNRLQSYLPRVKHLGKCFSMRCRIPAATTAFKAMPAVLLKCPIHPGTPETNPPGRRGMHSRMNSKAARTPIIRPSPRFSCSFRFGMACLAFCMSWKRAAFLPWWLGMRLLQWPNQQSRKKRKDYAFRHQFNEKPSIIPDCPGSSQDPSE